MVGGIQRFEGYFVVIKSKDKGKLSVICYIDWEDNELEKLREHNPIYIANKNPCNENYEEEVIKRIGDAEAILISISTPINARIMSKCSKLKFIQTWSTGIDNVDIDEANRRGILVSNVPDFSVESVSQATIGLMILAARKFNSADKHVRGGGWDYIGYRGCELTNKTICIVGYGKIGKRISEILQVFGMNIIKIDSKSNKKELLDALAHSDFVSINCSLNKETYHMIGKEEFKEMRNSAIVINTSRGGVVDEEALVEALEKEEIKYACCDVLEHEPPSIENQILKSNKVFITPHCAWNTEEAKKRLNTAVIEGIEGWFNGKIINQVK